MAAIVIDVHEVEEIVMEPEASILEAPKSDKLCEELPAATMEVKLDVEAAKVLPAALPLELPAATTVELPELMVAELLEVVVVPEEPMPAAEAPEPLKRPLEAVEVVVETPAEEAVTEEPPAKRQRVSEASATQEEQPQVAATSRWWVPRWPTRPQLLRWIWQRINRNQPAQATSSLAVVTFGGCSARPELNGVYKSVGDRFAEKLNHSHPTYLQEEGSFYVYYWCDEEDEESSGWYIGQEVASTEVAGFRLNCSPAELCSDSKKWRFVTEDATSQEGDGQFFCGA